MRKLLYAMKKLVFTANLANTGSKGQRYRPALNIEGKGSNLFHKLFAIGLEQIHLSLI
jgi:hypothetical protein